MNSIVYIDADDLTRPMHTRFFEKRGFTVQSYSDISEIKSDNLETAVIIDQTNVSNRQQGQIKSCAKNHPRSIILVLGQGEIERFQLVRYVCSTREILAESDAKRELFDLSCDEVEVAEETLKAHNPSLFVKLLHFIQGFFSFIIGKELQGSIA